MFNRLSEFIDKRGISRYRFWQDTQLGRDTAYRLCNDPYYVPTGAVLDKICSTYKVQPGEFLGWREDDPNENLSDRLPSPTSESEQKLSRTDNSDLEGDRLQVARLNSRLSRKAS